MAKKDVVEEVSTTPQKVSNVNGNSKVYVYFNDPHGQAFTMPDGRVVIFKGYPVSNLVLPNGEFIPGGMFGVSEVWRDDWDWIYRNYGYMGIFEKGLVFMAETKEKGDAMAKEREETRHGLEQIVPKNSYEMAS